MPTIAEPVGSPPTHLDPREADPKRWVALAVIAVAQLMVVLDASIVTIALPSAQSSLHISTDNRQWMVTAYTLAFGGLLLLGGRIADYVGRKRMFIIGLLGFAGASALGGVAVNAPMLFGARALQGAFAALLAPAALSLITVTFTEVKERATAFGVYGGHLRRRGGHRPDHRRHAHRVRVVALVSAGQCPDRHRDGTRGRAASSGSAKADGNTSYDIPGAVTVTAGLVSLVYGFTQAAQRGWTATSTLTFLGVAVVLLVAFVTIEVRTKNPLLPMRVVLDRNRGGSFLGSLMVGSGLLGMFLFLTYYFQENLGYSALKTGFAFLPFSAGIILAAGRRRSHPPHRPEPVMVVGFRRPRWACCG